MHFLNAPNLKITIRFSKKRSNTFTWKQTCPKCGIPSSKARRGGQLLKSMLMLTFSTKKSSQLNQLNIYWGLKGSCHFWEQPRNKLPFGGCDFFLHRAEGRINLSPEQLTWSQPRDSTAAGTDVGPTGQDAEASVPIKPARCVVCITVMSRMGIFPPNTNFSFTYSFEVCPLILGFLGNGKTCLQVEQGTGRGALAFSSSTVLFRFQEAEPYRGKVTCPQSQRKKCKEWKPCTHVHDTPLTL